MPAKVYVETTIVSYLTAWTSRELIMAANQEITRTWWNDHKDNFELYISQLVVEESAAGDSEAAGRRLKVLAEIPELSVNDDIIELAMALVAEVPLPPKAQGDAFHIAIAAYHGMDYLITWNCTHIANATLRSRIEDVCREAGCEPPIICTPQELVESEE